MGTLSLTLLLLSAVAWVPLACRAAILSGTVAGTFKLAQQGATNFWDFQFFGGIYVPPFAPPGDTNVYGNSNTAATGNAQLGPNAVNIQDGAPYFQGIEFYANDGIQFASANIQTNGQITLEWDMRVQGASSYTLTATTFSGLVLGQISAGACGAVSVQLSGTGPATTITVNSNANFGPCTITFSLLDPICFPASSTMRRLAPGAADTQWETVAVPELRLGDTVECLAREPAFAGDGTVSSAPHDGRLARCTVYDYKKAAGGVVAPYTRLTYEGAGAAPGAVSMSSNHHLLDPATGQARQAGSLRPGHLVLRATPEGLVAPARVLSVDAVKDAGAYAPLLSGGGLPIVDGVAAYPSSGESDVGLDAKHWGQFYLHAPVWQQRHDEAPPGRSLADLGAEQPVGAFTQKWHAVRAAAAREGRSSCDWAGVAKDMHAAIAQGKQFTEAEALAVLDGHLKAAPGVAAV